MFLENNHCAKVTLVPSHTAGDEREEREKARLEREMAGWSEEEKATLHTRQDVLTAWQKQEDTSEALASIPKLTLKDLESKPEDFPLEIVRAGETNILVHPLHTGGIVYVTLYFDADGLSREELSCLSLLCDLIGSLPTRTHTGNEVVTLQRLLLGQMSVAVQTFVKDGQNDTCLTKLCVGFNTLERNVQEAVAFITEMLTETQLTDEAQITEIIKQGKTTLSQQMIMAGHSAARKSLRAQLLSAGAVEECVDGFAAYSWVRSLEDHFAFAPLSESLRELYTRLICRRGLTISVTGDMTEEVQRAMNTLRDALPDGGPKKTGSLLLPRGMCREGIVIPAEIAFAVRGGYMPGFNGLMPLLSKVVSLGYLWNVIRVQGGAYGTGLNISPDGIAACYSYRDPNGAGSLEKYMGCADFVRNMCRENPDLTGFIIGTVSDASPLLTPRMKGQMADSLYWRELPYEVRCARRQEMLAATPAQLAELADRLDDAMKNSGICVVGSQRQLDACGKLDAVMSL